MVTVQQIFDMAIHLMDEQNEATGVTVTQDTQEYKYRTVSILNSVIPSLYPYSGNYDNTAPGRPMCPMLQQGSYDKPNFKQAIPLDDTLSLALLPYFLAAQLLSSENDELAAWFMTRYRETLYDIRSKIPAEFEKISTPYGLF
jgi:hypothetical protein